jgi:hypothetical protein
LFPCVTKEWFHIPQKPHLKLIFWFLLTILVDFFWNCYFLFLCLWWLSFNKILNISLLTSLATYTTFFRIKWDRICIGDECQTRNLCPKTKPFTYENIFAPHFSASNMSCKLKNGFPMENSTVPYSTWPALSCGTLSFSLSWGPLEKNTENWINFMAKYLRRPSSPHGKLFFQM